MHNLDSALINNLIFSVGISKLVLKLVFVSLVVISFFIDGSLAQTNAKNAELAAIIAKQKAKEANARKVRQISPMQGMLLLLLI